MKRRVCVCVCVCVVATIQSREEIALTGKPVICTIVTEANILNAAAMLVPQNYTEQSH